MAKGRSVLVKLTAFDGGLVIVETSDGKQHLVPAGNEVTAVLHELASDGTLPEMTSQAVSSNRWLDLAEKMIGITLSPDASKIAGE